MKNKYFIKILNLSAAIFIIVTFSGCATPVKKTTMRSSEVLLKNNPIKKVAIVGEAKVMRPRMNHKAAALSLSASKLFVEDSIPKLKRAYEEKGYEVVYAEPAAVGYYWRGPDNYWVFDFDAKQGQPDKWRMKGLGAVYEYPAMQANLSLKSAVKEEFERFNEAIHVNRLNVYDPKKENISTIGDATGADTVCLAHLWGKRYSAGRIAGDVALNVLAAMFGAVRTSHLQETRLVDLVCSEVSSGQVLWRSTHITKEDPISKVPAALMNKTEDQPQETSPNNSVEDHFFENAVATLPRVNQPISGNCRMEDRVRMLLACQVAGNETQPESDSE